MSWIVLSILAALTFAVTSIIDKYLLTKYIRKPIIPVLLLGLVSAVVAGLVFLLRGFELISGPQFLIALAAGFFYVLTNIFYFRAAKREEISRVIPLFYLAPLFVILLAGLFLKETFGLLTYLGIILLVAGAFTISIRLPWKIKINRAFIYMILASLVLAIYVVLNKHLLESLSAGIVFAYVRIGAVLTIIPLFCKNYKHLKVLIRDHGRKVPLGIAGNESLNLIGVLFSVLAMAVGTASLTNALTSLQPFFVLLFAVVISIFYPQILKEEIKRSTLLLKLVAIILIFSGAILIT